MIDQGKISEENARFWDELCGSRFARLTGIKDAEPQSFKKFDDWYLKFYPYLDRYIGFDSLRGKRVLEVGLGYGTVAQRLAEFGAEYSGLDIAAGPVQMTNYRLHKSGLNRIAVKGSVLEPPFDHESFDAIIAIGCLHYTGNLKVAIEQCRLMLRSGGRLTFMVYNAYSYRRWIRAPLDTLEYALQEIQGHRGVVGSTASRHRSAFDKSVSGEGAPHTDWISEKSLAVLCSNFTSFDSWLENVDLIPPLRFWLRPKLLNTTFPRRLGLDLYATATK